MSTTPVKISPHCCEIFQLSTGRKALYCGSWLAGSVGSDKCYSLDLMTNAWTLSGRMSHAKSHAGASVHPQLGLIQTGGLQRPGAPAINLVESTLDGVTFNQNYPRMPLALGCHCQVIKLLSCVRVVVDWFGYASFPSTSVYLLSPGYRFWFAFRASPSGSAVALQMLCCKQAK